MKDLHISAAPHIYSSISTSNIMLDVVIALVPAAIAAVVLFGLQALLIILTCIASAVLAEVLFNLCVHKKQTVFDFSAVVTGLLLALNLSTNVPLWQCALGSVFAIVVVKGLFGGLGKNIVNPAIAARVFMLLTFGAVGGGAMPTLVELEATATPLAELNKGVEGLETAPSMMDLFLGVHGGAIGETCAVALLVGFLYLVVRRVIKWYVPVSFVATVFLCYLVFTGDATYALAQVLAGGLILGAVFMATDYVTTPDTGLGRVIFCIGCGLLTFAIRQFGSYPEGVSISILTMNLFTPFIETWTTKKTLGGIK
ncbi:RnfABCDGE type electron transport complex subunit D [uncultured Neglectibacter sp.]|uniref:RnfABCDGE type electron transport complex subunit D n=1 Tax=uncultured Neglectibacter sp. TaxID=1924108 RepID=UPI0034E024FE